MMTKSEKLLAKPGAMVLCDQCCRKKPFSDGWFLTKKKALVCPECQPSVEKTGDLLVSV